MELQQCECSIKYFKQESSDNDADQPTGREHCRFGQRTTEDECNGRDYGSHRQHDEQYGVRELIELLLVKIQKTHSDRILRGQTDDGPEKCRVSNKENPDAIFGRIQRTRQNRGEQKRHQRLYAVGYSIEKGLHGQIALFPPPEYALLHQRHYN